MLRDTGGKTVCRVRSDPRYLTDALCFPKQGFCAL